MDSLLLTPNSQQLTPIHVAAGNSCTFTALTEMLQWQSTEDQVALLAQKTGDGDTVVHIAAGNIRGAEVLKS